MTTRSGWKLVAMATLGSALALTSPRSAHPSGADSSGGGGSASKKTLTVWSWRVEDEAAYNKIFDVYEKSHRSVNVDFKPFKSTEYNKILATGLAGSRRPRHAAGALLRPAPGHRRAGKSLVPLDGKVDLSGWDENVVASAKGKEDGKTYSVPLARQTVQMFYNKGLFEKNGLKRPHHLGPSSSPPTQARGAPGVTPIAVGAKDDWTLPIVHEVLAAPRFGGKTFQSEVHSGQKYFTDPDWVASVKVVERPREVHAQERHRRRPVTDAQTLFSAEKAAMIPGG